MGRYPGSGEDEEMKGWPLWDREIARRGHRSELRERHDLHAEWRRCNEGDAADTLSRFHQTRSLSDRRKPIP